MYIHNYQIHNVLNAYRKQLSQSPAKAGPERPSQTPSDDRVPVSKKGRPPAIVNQISTEIIDRIARFGPKSEFDNVVANQLAPPNAEESEQNGLDFTYSMIDEQNRKTMQTRAMNSLNSLKYQDTMKSPASNDTTRDQAPTDGALENMHKTPNEWKG